MDIGGSILYTSSTFLLRGGQDRNIIYPIVAKRLHCID